LGQPKSDQPNLELLTLERWAGLPDRTRTATPAGSVGPATRTATDWDQYYRRPFQAARLTRKITAANLVRQIQRFVCRRPVIVELGGADSCFFPVIRSRIRPSQYHVLDNNQVGLDRFRQRLGGATNVFTSNQDVLCLSYQAKADLVFSAGLIEHFGPEGTLAAIAAHFQLLKPGGIAMMTFPTPTVLYRTARRLAERAGIWMFPDERPLRLEEVAAAGQPHGTVLLKRLIWPIVLTQYLLVWQKR
jgi:hypothetical protein